MKNTKEAPAPTQKKESPAPPASTSPTKVGKDIPVTNKGPRRQKSSRFQVNESRPELERLPAFKG